MHTTPDPDNNNMADMEVSTPAKLTRDPPLTQTTASISRHLRRKGVPLVQILPFANEIVAGNLNVYFPHRLCAVLQWWMDKISEKTDSAKEARADPAFWTLFITVWEDMAKDLAMPRERIYRNSKFTEIVSLAIKENIEGCSVQLLDEITTAVNKVSRSLAVQFTESAAVEIAGDYLKTLTNFQKTGLPVGHIAGVSSWTQMILNFLERSSQGSQDMQKKCREVGSYLPYIFYLLDGEDLNKDLAHFIDYLVTKFLFDPEHFPITGLYAFTTFEVLSFSTEAPVRGYAHIIRLGEKVAATMPGTTGEKDLVVPLVSGLIQNAKQYTVELLDQCTEMGYKVEKSILVRLFNEAVPTREAFALDWQVNNERDWRLIAALVRQDPSLTATSVSLAKDISDGPDNEYTKSVMRGMATGYQLNSNMYDFIIIWVDEMAKSSKWRDPGFLPYVSDLIAKMFPDQYYDVLTHWTGKVKEEQGDIAVRNNQLYALVAIVNALLFMKLEASFDEKVLKVLSKLIKLEDEKIDSETLWRLRYIIFTKAPNTKHKIDFNEAVEPKKELFRYQFGCLCRLAEFDNVKKFDKALDKHLSYMVKKKLDGMIPFLFDRWLVILNRFAKSKRLCKIAEMAVSTYVTELVQNDQLFEQTHVWTPVLENIKDPKPLTVVPYSAFPRDIRIALVNKFSLENPTAEGLELVSRLVTSSTLGGYEIEKDVDSFCVLLDHGSALSTSICSTILKSHVQTKNQDTSKEFLETLEKKLKKNVKNNKSIQQALLYARIVSDEDSNFIKSIRKSLKTIILESNDTDLEPILNDTKSLVKVFSSSDSDEVETKLTSIISKRVASKTEHEEDTLLTSAASLLMGISKPNLAITALFLCVGEGNEQLSKWYSFHLESLSPEELRNVFVMVVRYGESAYPAFEVIIRVLSYDEHHEIDFTSLIVSAISQYVESGKQSAVFLGALASTLKRAPWAVSQYCLELILVVVSQSQATPDTFVAFTQVLSQILLSHRPRIEGRYSLIVYSLKALLSVLVKGTEVAVEDVHSLVRAVQLICEPPAYTLSKTRAAKVSLTSATQAARKEAARHMIYFLAAYAHINVTQKLDAAITVAFRPAMSSIFELVTKEDLDLANSIMDGPSRSFIRVLYADYKKQGKWTDDM